MNQDAETKAKVERAMQIITDSTNNQSADPANDKRRKNVLLKAKNRSDNQLVGAP